MAGFEDGGTLMFGNRCRARSTSARPGPARKATAVLAAGARLMVTASPGWDSGGHDAGPRRASSCRPTAVPAR